MRRLSATSAILIGGAIGGLCDITYAIVFSWAMRGTSPVRILQSVASGLLGKPAFEGGWPTAALGLCLHFFIAISAAVIFYFAATRLALLTRHPVVSGVAYGFVIYWVMNLVVLPLSAIPFKVTFAPLTTGTGLIVHMFLVGVPIALAIRRAVALPGGQAMKQGQPAHD
jgi:hypothetical protein